ncbi:MAG: hypothetical protein FWC09_06885 [Lachnospiraceae bacterium]|nr:hypothetical protein [Lachnospiraceae bacterium]
MKVSLEQTEKLLCGNHSFTQIGLSMMMTRMRGAYAKDPSPEVLTKSMEELNLFFDKFKSLVEKDYSVIAQL